MKDKITQILKKHFPDTDADFPAIAEEIFEEIEPGKAYTFDGKVDDKDDIIGGEEVTTKFTETVNKETGNNSE